MVSYKKVLRSHFTAICGMCNHIFELSNEYMAKQEELHGTIPFSAKSSNTAIFCPKCNYSEFRLNFKYQNLYRRRCPECGRIIPDDAKMCPYCGKKFKSYIEKEEESIKVEKKEEEPTSTVTKEVKTSLAYCPKCREKLDEGVEFCTECGEKLE